MQFMPMRTPMTLKIVLFATILCSLFSSFLAPYFVLSAATLHHFYLWQLVTYILIHPFPSGLFHLAFNLYFIWIFGSSLLERIKAFPFCCLYFGSSICGGLLALACLSISPSLVLFGSSAALYGVLLSWILFNPEAILFLFGVLPLKARHALGILIAANLLIDLSQARWVFFCAYIGAILFSYLFTLLVFRVRSPFAFLKPLENVLLRTVENMKNLFSRSSKASKVYDIKSGKPILNDEQFMDAMLQKIALYGESCVTTEEKTRMEKISKKFTKPNF